MAQTKVNRYNGVQKPNIIRFQENYNNKLVCDYFTSIVGVENANYLILRIGEIFEVYLKDVFITRALLLDASLKDLAELTPELLILDAGNTNYKGFFDRIGSGNQCVLCVFRRLK